MTDGIWIRAEANGDVIAVQGPEGPEIDRLTREQQLDADGNYDHDIERRWLDWLEGKGNRP